MAKDLASLSALDNAALVAAIMAAGLPPALRAAARTPNLAVLLGDSRASNNQNDTGRLSKSTQGPLVWANALSGQRLIIGPNFAVSGSLTSALDAQVAQAVTTAAGVAYVMSGINSIAGGVAGDTAAGEVIAAIKRLLAAGLRVIVEQEVGSTNLSAAQVVELNKFRRTLADYAVTANNVFLHDAQRTVMVGTATTVAFKTGYTAGQSDPTHLGNLGAYQHGKSLATLIRHNFSPRFGFGLQSVSDTWAAGGIQLLENPAFTTATGGTKGGTAANTTGDVPAWWTINPGAATVAVSLVADPDGVGNNLKLDISFTAPDQIVLLTQDAQGSRYALGDNMEASSKVDVTGAAVRYVTLYSEYNNGSQTIPARDLWGNATDAGPGEAYTADLLTRTRKLDGTKGFLNARLSISSSSAGNASVIIRNMALRKRSDAALY